MVATAAKTFTYAILVEYQFYRGAVLAFSLSEAISKMREYWSADSVAITVRYADGRDDIDIDPFTFTRPSINAEQARTLIITSCKEGLAALARGEVMGRDACNADNWQRIVMNGPTESVVATFVREYDPIWFSDEEIAAWERDNIPA